MSQSTNKTSKTKRTRPSKDNEGAEENNNNNSNVQAPPAVSGQPRATPSQDLEAKFAFHGDGDEHPKKKHKVGTDSSGRTLQHPYHNWKKLASESRVVIGDKIFLADLTLSDPKNSNNTIRIHPGCKVKTRIGRVDTDNLIVYGIIVSNLGKKLTIFVNSLDHSKDQPPYAIDIDSVVDVHENESWDHSIADAWLDSMKKENEEQSEHHQPRSTHHSTTRRTILGLNEHEVSHLVQAIITPILSDFAKQFRSVIAEIHEKDEIHHKMIMEEFKELWASNTKMMVDLFSLLNERNRANDK